MTAILCKLFIRNPDNTRDPRVRGAYATLTSAVGIILNLLLFAGKFLAGSISGSVAICADAMNNLSDAGSQVLTLVGCRMAAKEADRDHPFGHARMEYVTSMIVSFIRQLIVLIPAAFVLALLGQRTGNSNLVWWSYPIAEVVALGITLAYYLRLNRRLLSKLPDNGETPGEEE